jgi:hypothetical protein
VPRPSSASTTPGGSPTTARSAGPLAILPCRGGATGAAGLAVRSPSRSVSMAACGSARRTSASPSGPHRLTPGSSGRAGSDRLPTGIRQLASRNGSTPAGRQPHNHPAGSSAGQVRIIPGAAVGTEADDRVAGRLMDKVAGRRHPESAAPVNGTPKARHPQSAASDGGYPSWRNRPGGSSVCPVRPTS